MSRYDAYQTKAQIFRLKFAQVVFRFAGISGWLVIVPLYFLEDRIGRDTPPPITHPEYFYGFLGVALAWQIAFLIIGNDPVRFRPLIPAAMIEKFGFCAALAVLWFEGRLPSIMLPSGAMDLALGVLFGVAFVSLGGESKAKASRAASELSAASTR